MNEMILFLKSHFSRFSVGLKHTTCCLTVADKRPDVLLTGGQCRHSAGFTLKQLENGCVFT